MPFVWEDEQSGEDILAMWNWPGCAQRALCLCLYRSLRMRLCPSSPLPLHLPLSACLPVCRLLLPVGLKCLLPRSGRYGSYPHNPPVLVPGLDHALVYNFAGDNVRRHNAARASRR